MKNLKIKNTGILLMSLGCLLFTSCESNQICFDIRKQMICSKDNAIISKLYIEQEKGDLILIELKDNSSGKEYFSLRESDTINYTYEVLGIRKKIKTFLLNPNKTYEVENKSVGDVAGGKLTIKTDIAGTVIYANVKCN